MVSDTSTRHDLTAVHEIEVDVHRSRGHEQHAGHIPGALVRPAVLVLARVRVTDSRLKLGLTVGRGGQKGGDSKKTQNPVDASHSVPIFCEVRDTNVRDSGIICSSW